MRGRKRKAGLDSMRGQRPENAKVERKRFKGTINGAHGEENGVRENHQKLKRGGAGFKNRRSTS